MGDNIDSGFVNKTTIVVVNNDVTGRHGRSSSFTQREKRLTFAVVLLLLVLLALASVLILSGHFSSIFSLTRKSDLLDFSDVICDTKECVDISYRALHSANFSADPCHDFYDFACSKWQRDNPILKSSEQLYISDNVNHIRDKVDNKIKNLLEKIKLEKDTRNASSESQNRTLDSLEGEAAAAEAAADFYQSCLNFNRVSQDESRIVGKLLTDLGGYQTAEVWDDSKFDLTHVIAQFLKMNSAPFFDVTLDIDPFEKTQYAIIVELPRAMSIVPNLLRPRGGTRGTRRHPSWDDEFLYMNYLSKNLKFGESLMENGNATGTSTFSSNQARVVDRHELYKLINDNVETKKLDELKTLAEKAIRQTGKAVQNSASDVKQILIFAASIETLKPSQRSRKFWKQQNKVYNNFTLESLQSQFDAVNWKQLLEILLPGKRPGLHRRPRNWIQTATVYVAYPDYIRRLLQAIQFTNKRLLYNTMLLIYIRDLMSDLMHPKKRLYQQQREVASSPSSPEGQTESDPDPKSSTTKVIDDTFWWKFCVQSTKSVFAMELSSLYVRSFAKSHLNQMKRELEQIFGGVKNALLSLLDRSSTTGNGVDEAKKKIQSLKASLIAAPFYFDPVLMSEEEGSTIREVKIDQEDFVGNIRSVYKIFREELYRLYWTEVNVDKATWSFVTFPTEVNAYYIQQFNTIVIPLAFLNPPHFTHSAPKYVNYATMGLTIAHEAMHAIDSSGSDFDDMGIFKYHHLHQNHNQFRGHLSDKSSCVAKQYSDVFYRQISSFQNTLVNIQVDGNLTHNENLADVIGLQIAFQAYVNFRAGIQINDVAMYTTEIQKLPGINYSLRETFFLSVAQAYCANISPVGYIFLLEIDEHTPHPERINGMLMNNNEFATAFRCPVGSRMNPKLKCNL